MAPQLVRWDFPNLFFLTSLNIAPNVSLSLQAPCFQSCRCEALGLSYLNSLMLSSWLCVSFILFFLLSFHLFIENYVGSLIKDLDSIY